MSGWGKQQSIGGKAGQQGGANTDKTDLTGPNFDAMYEQKRSQDPASAARRQSLSEQRPSGSLGEKFKNFVSGSGGPNPGAS